MTNDSIEAVAAEIARLLDIPTDRVEITTATVMPTRPISAVMTRRFDWPRNGGLSTKRIALNYGQARRLMVLAQKGVS